jgi:hypothetical protein
MKTDNSNIMTKIRLRESVSFDGAKVKNKTSVTAIEKEHDKNKKALTGDNLKYLHILDISKFDIIDLDAYGIPFEQLEAIFKRQFKGIIIVTAIQSMTGALPFKMLCLLGYTKSMIKKCPSLFYRNGDQKLKNYLYLRGIKKIHGTTINRKSYFYFQT